MNMTEIKTKATADLTAAAKIQARKITGKIAVFGKTGQTSGGRTVFAANSLRFPDPLSKVKLLANHDMNSPVGYLEEISEDGDGVTGTFIVPPGEPGDIALAEAKARIRDGLSVGVEVEQVDSTTAADGVMTVTAARVFEVSLVAVPAFEDTLIENVTAARGKQNEENKEMTEEVKENQNTAEEQEVTEEHAAAESPANITAGINAAKGIRVKERGMTLTAAADRLITGIRDGENSAVITAALNDVIPADDKGKGFLRETWIGELWQASQVGRPFIEMFGAPGKLDGLYAYGWKWDLTKLPKVEKYAGNKTEIPSNKIATVPVTGAAQDFAAGWDIARKYIDLGATGYIESVFRMAADDYRRKTDAWFAGEILKQATEVQGVTSVLTALQKLPVSFAKIGAKMSAIQLGAAAYESFVNLKSTEVPWWLREQGSVDLADSTGVAAGIKIESNPALEDNQIVAVDSRAATYYEHGSSPIKVQALEIAKGGIDLGVFGYAAQIVHDPRAIMKATVTPTGAAG